MDLQFGKNMRPAKMKSKVTPALMILFPIFFGYESAQATTCTNSGRLQYLSNTLQICDGTNWYPIGASATGNVGIGTTAPAYTLDVTGTIRATNLILTSDRRAKKNINSLDEAESLDKLSRLNPVSFEWKNSGEADLGIIAQELAEVYPELVLKDQQGALSIRSTSLIAPLIASVKKLKSDNELLREENGKQKSRLDELEKKFNALAAKIEK